jgi:outer membrane protein OmpA-like peptidoglycan-associated protein
VKGVIENKSGESIGQTSLEIKTTQSGNITKIEVDSSSGEYAAVVAIKANEDAVLTVKKKGYAFNSQIIKGNDENIGKPIKINEQIQEVVTGGAYSIKDINYGSNSANLAEESKSILEGFAEYLLENEDLKIEIRGHTDNVGSSSANLALSSDRAFTVMDFLMQKGVPKSRLSFKGYGDTKPIAPNTTPEGKAKNRRTEFVILSK